MKQKGNSSVLMVIIAAVFLIVIAGEAYFITIEQAKTRDAIRMADVARLAAGFGILFAEKGSYADAAVGCSTVGSLAGTCALPTSRTLGTISDPGKYTYRVTVVPTRDAYAISFQLERGSGQYAKGLHTLSNQGIQ